jgi:hypothetical protein
MLNTQFIETRMFKEVPGGFIFQLPPPTIFTPTEAVVVTSAQREEILAITRKGSAMAGRLCFWGAIAVGILVGHASGHIEDMPAALSVFLGFCAAFVTMILGAVASTYQKLAVLRPLLAPLPRSPELLFPVGPKVSWTDFGWVRRRAAQG